MKKTYRITKPTEFRTVVEECFAVHQTRDTQPFIILLEGDLGAGKTTFVQELGLFLGVVEPVVSPTFPIMKQYNAEHAQFNTLIHIDVYRFESETEAKPLHLEEIFHIPQAVVCVEWPERIENLLPKNAVIVQISIGEGETRQVTVTYPKSGGDD